MQACVPSKMSVRGKGKILHSLQCERVACCVADLLQLSHFGTLSVCFQEKGEEGTRLRGSPGSPGHSQQQTPVFRSGRRRGQKRRHGPFKRHSTFSKIPSCTRSSCKLSTYLDISSLTGYDWPAGQTSLLIGFACTALSLLLAFAPATRR